MSQTNFEKLRIERCEGGMSEDIMNWMLTSADPVEVAVAARVLADSH